MRCLFVNAGADLFDPVQFKAVHDAVKDLGLGFLMVGGRNSFGPGGYHKTPIEEVLPVSMDVTKKKVLPKGALVIVLHTCEFPGRKHVRQARHERGDPRAGLAGRGGDARLHAGRFVVGLRADAGQQLRRDRPQDQRLASRGTCRRSSRS